MIEILYEDNHLLALNKPAGLLTQPSGTLQDSLETQAKLYIKEKYQKPGNVYLEAVHRIDKSVSGIVLFAKTSKALSRLNEQIRDGVVKKTYFATVEIAPQKKEGRLEHYLIHDDFRATIVKSGTPSSKLAILEYRFLRKEGPYDLLEINLITGRYHQIRAQLGTVGCPIVGDQKYGSKEKYFEGQIALHHGRFEFLHPITEQTIVIQR